MLFKKKDQNESVKAKTALEARAAKRTEAPRRGDDEAADKSAQGGSASGRKDEARAVSAKKGAKSLAAGAAAGRVSPNVLRRPRITEKATVMSQYNVYTFDIATSANKKLVAAAVKDVYGITPTKVRVVTIPAKTVRNRRGMAGTTSSGKKAYVYLKKGDTIELV